MALIQWLQTFQVCDPCRPTSSCI